MLVRRAVTRLSARHALQLLMNDDAKRLVVLVKLLAILFFVGERRREAAAGSRGKAGDSSFRGRNRGVHLFARFFGVRQAVKQPALIFPPFRTSLTFLGYASFLLRPSTLRRILRTLTTKRTSSRNPGPLYSMIFHPRFHTSPAHDHLPLTIW